MRTDLLWDIGKVWGIRINTISTLREELKTRWGKVPEGSLNSFPILLAILIKACDDAGIPPEHRPDRHYTTIEPAELQFPEPNRRGSPSKLDAAQVQALRDRGLSVAAIAAELKVTRTTVYRALKRDR